MTLTVFCTGRYSESHDRQPVYPVLGAHGSIFECPLCKYDVHVDRELEEDLDGLDLELHNLAQVVTARGKPTGPRPVPHSDEGAGDD